jgi:glycosyltransferase involved in cell wall biosynthesis
VEILRYRYAPKSMQTLVYGGGILTNLRRSPWKLLLLPGFVLAQYLAARRVIVRDAIMIVHAHWLIPQGMVARWLAKRFRFMPYVVTSHGSDLHGLKGRFMRALKARVVVGASAITVVSPGMRSEVESLGMHPSRLEVLPMGVDMRERFTPQPDTQRSHNEILFVGRLVARKGLMTLIEAMPAIVRSVPDAVLLVAGYGPERDANEERVRALHLEEHVKFLGAIAQEDLPDLYRRAAVFVAPAIVREGLGLVVLEAAACCCPVVASDFPAMHLMLGEEKPNAYVPPGDSSSLATALVDMLKQPVTADKLELRRSRLVDNYDWETVAERYGDLLLDCLEHVP